MSTFGISTKVFFGKTRHDDTQAFLQGRGINKVVTIVDGAVSSLPAIDDIIDGYRKAGFDMADPVIYDVQGEPSYDELDAFAASLRDLKPELILAIGGGSIMDMAKGVAVLMANPGKGIDYRGMHKVTNPSIPLVAYPTTAGTGAEVTWTASFVDTAEEKKLGINGQNVSPLCGVLEPQLVASAPRSVALSAGLDTMLHAIEAVTAKTATEITIALGARAFAMMYSALPKCLSGEGSLDDWEEAQLSAYLAGIAMMNAGGGPASGISYPLGVHYKTPHGFAGGIFLSGVFAHNVSVGYQGYAPVYDLLADATPGLDVAEKNADFVKKFDTFYDLVGGPRTLEAWGCTGADAIEKLTSLTMEQRMENLELNPVDFGKADVEALLEPLCR